MTLTPGTLLLARPFLGDPNFERTVILICRHDDEEGTFGLVLNRLTELVLPDVLPFLDADVPGTAAPLPLAMGGPVQQNSLHYIHRLPDLPDAIALGENSGVFWGGDFDALTEEVQAGRLTPANARFFVGYSGWAAGQLAEEISRETWVVRKDAAAKVFTFDPESLWQGVLREMGGRYRLLANYPIDPSLN